MKLKAQEGVGDPCIAGVAIELGNGVCEVEPEVGAVLIESFGFIEITGNDNGNGSPAPRRARPAKKA